MLDPLGQGRLTFFDQRAICSLRIVMFDIAGKCSVIVDKFGKRFKTKVLQSFGASKLPINHSGARKLSKNYFKI